MKLSHDFENIISTKVGDVEGLINNDIHYMSDHS